MNYKILITNYSFNHMFRNLRVTFIIYVIIRVIEDSHYLFYEI